MVGADGEVGRRRPRLDLLVRAMGEDPVRETLDVSGEDWESILSGGMELDGTLLARRRIYRAGQLRKHGFRNYEVMTVQAENVLLSNQVDDGLMGYVHSLAH